MKNYGFCKLHGDNVMLFTIMIILLYIVRYQNYCTLYAIRNIVHCTLSELLYIVRYQNLKSGTNDCSYVDESDEFLMTKFNCVFLGGDDMYNGPLVDD